MSMLSSKCDGLRDRAHELRMFADGLSAPYIVPSTKETMGLSMQSAATELERAADTIWELRCKLAGVVDQQDEIERLQSENAKLRKLVSLYHYGATHEASPSDTLAWNCKVDSLRRELGMEL